MIFTWYGHSAFRIEFGGTRVLLDPYLTGNPSWGKGWEEAAEGISHILLTHGHDDHVGDTVAIAKATGAEVVGPFEVCGWVASQGVERINPGGPGGTIDCGSFKLSFVPAIHSSSKNVGDGLVYTGNPCGLVIAPTGDKTIYAMGDTTIFGDMALIEEIYEPKVGIVPIGDRFTMGGAIAAMAVKRYFRFDNVIPCHYGTYPVLDQGPETFVDAMGGERASVVLAEIGKPFEI